MRKILMCLCFLSGGFLSVHAQQGGAKVSSFPVYSAGDGVSESGTFSKKIALKSDIVPSVRLVNIQTRVVDAVPKGIKVHNSFDPDIWTGKERKKSFAYVVIPAYRKTGDKIEMLVSCDLEVAEPLSANAGNKWAQRPAAAQNSVLASGTWYKIAVPSRGVVKIDYSFLQSIGAEPGSINPANIRLYGNGGTVLPETADSNQPDDLIENAIVVQSAGSTFGPNDYILFYANGPVLWEGDSVNQRFKHTNNWYENYSYYFLNFDQGPGKRITTENADGAGISNPVAVTTFNDYQVYDIDSFNAGGIGKIWWSNRMSPVGNTLEQNFNFNLGRVSGPVSLETSVASKSDNNGNVMRVLVDNDLKCSFNMRSQGDEIITVADTLLQFNSASGNVNVKLRYTPNGNGTGYVDFLRFNYRRELDLNGTGGQLAFRDWQTAGLGAGQYATYQLANPGNSIKVWDISNPLQPVELLGAMANGKYNITREANGLKEFVAYDGSNFLKPVALTSALVENQNLHAMHTAELLIITRKDLLPAAEALAAFHRSHDQISVAITTTDKIYNEFSSGGQDIGGIRNFIKMFYDRAANETEIPKNVLFFGAASYDYKDRLAFNTNIVPTFQTLFSDSYSGSRGAYSSDDFYALLDNGNDQLLDLGTGRIPVFDLDEGYKVVEKIKNYCSPNSFGPWKNIVSYVADDAENGMDHLGDCEQVNGFFQKSDRLFNLYKLYSDAHPIVAAAGGSRYPSMNKAINDRIANGTLLMSYSGHGNPERWAHEAILTPDDYGAWTNINSLPVMVTATCDFGRFDDPGQRSAGAKMMINPKGGAIAMVTTTQVVYPGPNTTLNAMYTQKQFLQDEKGNYRTLGEALTAAKNDFTGGGNNNRKFVVLGDPALTLQIPSNGIKTTKLYQQDADDLTEADTISALGRYVLEGNVVDRNGNVLDDFNGTVYVTIFDKIRTVPTINPNRPIYNGGRSALTFETQTNTVAKIRGTVENGVFSAAFVAPKDINYEYGFGKISYYAHSDQTDATGMDTAFTIGGYNENAVPDGDGPVVRPFIDNDKFRDGGVTGPNPSLYVTLFDENGINVSGNSVGHDLIAILDDDVANPFVMNDFYQTEQNDYRHGFVNFKFYNLPEGKHTIKVRAWDVYNNSGEGTVTFEVKNKDKGFISDLYNYPNPVRDVTHFVFQHNQEGEEMDITLRIFTASGQLVKTMKKHIETTDGNRTELTWDGTTDAGPGLPKGVYFYSLHAKTGKGISATAYQKLVLLR